MGILKGFLGLIPQLLMKGDSPVKQLLHNPLISPMGSLLLGNDNQHNQAQPPVPLAPEQQQPVPGMPMTPLQRRMALRQVISASVARPAIVQTQPVVVDPSTTGI